MPEQELADLPFAGGWFVLLGYELAQRIEPKLRLPPSPFALPDALAVRCPAAVVFDRMRELLHLRAAHPALGRGGLVELLVNADQYAYLRTSR